MYSILFNEYSSAVCLNESQLLNNRYQKCLEFFRLLILCQSCINVSFYRPVSRTLALSYPRPSLMSKAINSLQTEIHKWNVLLITLSYLLLPMHSVFPVSYYFILKQKIVTCNILNLDCYSTY